MPAITSLITRDDGFGQLAKRENWAQQEAGVVLVFCIVGVIALGLGGLFISRAISKRKAARAT